jgi:hypothetical protein
MRNKALTVRRKRRVRRRQKGRGFLDWLKSASKWALTGAAGMAGTALGGPMGGAIAGGLTRKLLGNGRKKKSYRRRRRRRRGKGLMLR